jgi:hypothetical protein
MQLKQTKSGLSFMGNEEILAPLKLTSPFVVYKKLLGFFVCLFFGVVGIHTLGLQKPFEVPIKVAGA